MKKTLLLAVASLFAVTTVTAQESTTPKLTIKPSGRILMDAAEYMGNTQDLFKPGVGIPDVRIGVSATYGNWKAMVDVGFAYGKVGLKDIYFQYNFNGNNFLRAGSFIHQYGLQAATSSSMKCTMEEPTSNAVFNNDRQIGAMFLHSGDKFFGAGSVHVEQNSSILTPTQLGQQGYGIMTRLVYRPVHEEGKVVQAGISGAFATPKSETESTGNKHHLVRLAGNFPTRVEKVLGVDATVDHAMNLFKFTPELLVAYGPVAFEAQYFYNQVNRRQNLKSYHAQGAYGTFRGLIKGGKYGYSMMDGGLATPRPKSLEVCIMYNYTSLSDTKLGIHGGRMSDISCTFNYYINKYMIARLRYGFTKRWDLAQAPDVDLSAIQARLQIIF